ncbi:MAG: DUF308 domain-containing protein [Bacteroidales bacterium]|nr:DUF308 domain-containing protein [Bacteroidales bacterium]
MNKHRWNKWELLAANGIAAIFLGALAIFIPSTALLTVVKYFGIVILLLAVGILAGTITNIRNHNPYALDLTGAIVLLVLGFLLTFYSQNTIEIFVIITGSWAILLGIAQLIFAFNVDPDMNSKNTLLINSIISIVFGIILLYNPFKSAEILVVLTGILAIWVGIILVMIAIKMKRFFNQLKDI